MQVRHQCLALPLSIPACLTSLVKEFIQETARFALSFEILMTTFRIPAGYLLEALASKAWPVAFVAVVCYYSKDCKRVGGSGQPA